MAAQRPVVLVFQEFATLSTTPATPELNCLIAGPAYWIQDFPDDKASIKLSSAYGVGASSAPSGSSVATSALTVAEPPNNKTGAVLDQASVRVFCGSPVVELGFGSDVTTTTGSPSVSSLAFNFVTAGVQPLDTLVVSNGVTTLTSTIRTVSATTLTLYSDVPFTSAGAATFRVQRTLSDTELDASFLTFTSGSNSFDINALATLPVSGVDKLIVACDVYVAYRSLRLDLQEVGTIESVSAISSAIGKIDARNPLAVGVFVAMQNTNTSIQCFGVQSDDLAGYTLMRDAIGGRKDIYAIVPLTQDIAVAAMLKADVEQMADTDYALTNGVPQKFRAVIGNFGTLPTTKLVIDTQADGDSQLYAAMSPPTTTHTLSIPGVDLVLANVQPGDSLVISLDAAGTTRDGTYTVAQVLSATSLELDTEPAGGAQTGNASVQILVGSTAAVRLATTAITGLQTNADAKLYLDLYDPNGTFLDDGVIPTDLVELPKDPTSTSFTSKDSFVVATVVSNQRLRIVNNGRSTSLVANELPHGVSRSSPAVVVPSGEALHYRISRTLDKTGQVSQLVAVSQSLKSRRVVNVWPDLCDISGLTDGSLARDPADPLTAMPAATQPGYYLACAVGGMTAGLPSHQGFTNIAIAGVSKLYDSNTYFSDKQVSDVSNGGWFVFQQDTPSALPYVVHQLTTDVTSLQTGEFSMVKNFDFVSLFFSDILEDYIGTWNVNPETLGFINAAVNNGIDNLKLRRRPRIGAPLVDATLTKIQVSPSSADRIELWVEAKFPAPLNIVALHLVSV